MSKRPLKFGVGLTGKMYATRAYRQEGNCIVVTGNKEDITDEFKREMNLRLRAWVDAGYIEVKPSGAQPINEYFGLTERAKEPSQ